jgi:hypothetical protein
MKERISGGLAAGRKPEDFDAEQLKNGTKVEMEHTTNRWMAREIAMDHLVEDPHYYVKLKRMEARKALESRGLSKMRERR